MNQVSDEPVYGANVDDFGSMAARCCVCARIMIARMLKTGVVGCPREPMGSACSLDSAASGNVPLNASDSTLAGVGGWLHTSSLVYQYPSAMFILDVGVSSCAGRRAYGLV